MTDYPKTILEIFSHLVRSHPELAANYEKIFFESAFNHKYKEWESRQFASPSPHFVKQACLLRNGLENAIWVETGTYLGDTTQKLSQIGSMVYSIEPEPVLFAKAKSRFELQTNVEIINGLSEEVFPALLPRLSGDVCFWLDGHFSAGITHKGPQDTPIADELYCIGENLQKMNRAVVMVDDIRCFDPKIPEYSEYPSLNFLVEWAAAHAMKWHIEHDMFIARKA